MTERQQYLKRPGFHVTAVQLDLNFEGFGYNKWGDGQKCSAGDWLVNNCGDTYTVEKEYFIQHYEEVSPGQFEKIAPVWAEIAKTDGAIETIEGTSAYITGDYLVFDRSIGGQAYAVTKLSFERMYEVVPEPIELSAAQESYLEQRLEKQIQWYDRSAHFNRINYFLWQTLTIIAAALVPVLSTGDNPNVILIAVLGSASAIFAGLLSVFKFQENWVKFRASCEDLRSHISQFRVQSGGYDNRTLAFKLLVENCERIIGAERGQWVQQNSQQKDATDSPATP
ncbi:DUF4231 domain-containing protein [Teredinibacter purpureus]|uniref:DUF4231 domain-containing protein n=1 Tax=Teredinibacter purpureus TaxID=2731756 RepID=UPI00069645C8|nr:DUF4231 domain-containing protein [Teredinibacter purpureus]